MEDRDLDSRAMLVVADCGTHATVTTTNMKRKSKESERVMLCLRRRMTMMIEMTTNNNELPLLPHAFGSVSKRKDPTITHDFDVRAFATRSSSVLTYNTYRYVTLAYRYLFAPQIQLVMMVG